jgi:hypothetical protein
MTTLLVTPPFKKQEWTNLHVQALISDAKFSEYLALYARASSQAHRGRLNKLLSEAGICHGVNKPEDIERLMVQMIRKEGNSLNLLEDFLIVFSYCQYCRNQPELWRERSDKMFKDLRYRVSLTLLLWINHHFGLVEEPV